MENIVTADAESRVVLEGAVEGDRFKVSVDGDRRVFEKLPAESEPVEQVTPVRRNGRLMLPKKLDAKTVHRAVREDREKSQ